MASQRQLDDSQAKLRMMRNFILEHNGVTLDQIMQHVNLSETPTRDKLKILKASGDIESFMNPNRASDGGQMRSIWAAKGSMPTMPAGAKVDRPARAYVCKRFRPHDDFRGRKFVAAVQIGIARDPLIAALFGAGSAT